MDAGQQDGSRSTRASEKKCGTRAFERPPRTQLGQESSGRPGPVRTFQDLLKRLTTKTCLNTTRPPTSRSSIPQAEKSRHLARRGYSARSMLRLMVDMYWSVTSIARFQYLYPDFAFPRDVEIWDAKGKVIYKVASLPLADQIPTDGVTYRAAQLSLGSC